jgi:hypothetical protein
MRRLASYKAGIARTKALEADLVYDENQGPPSRAAEAYRLFPDVIHILRDAGAKRMCELEGTSKGDYIEQPGEWDKRDILEYGFTAETQPDREGWGCLYELARYGDGHGGRSWLGLITGGRMG